MTKIIRSARHLDEAATGAVIEFSGKHKWIVFRYEKQADGRWLTVHRYLGEPKTLTSKALWAAITRVTYRAKPSAREMS